MTDKGYENHETLWSLASEYLEAAIVLINTPPKHISYLSVIYYLLGHSAELSLKSFLFHQGETLTKLKGIGHDLKQLILISQDKGLAIEVVESLLDLSPIYSDKKGFEYRKQMNAQFPNQNLLLEEVQALQKAVFDRISKF